MTFAHHDIGHWVEGILRFAAIILLAASTAFTTRYYLITRRRSLVWLLTSLAAYTVALLAMVIENISVDGKWSWWQTPFALVGSIAAIGAVWPYVRFKPVHLLGVVVTKTETTASGPTTTTSGPTVISSGTVLKLYPDGTWESTGPSTTTVEQTIVVVEGPTTTTTTTTTTEDGDD